MLKSKPSIFIRIEFNRQMTKEEYENIEIETITFKLYNENNEKYKTTKFRFSDSEKFAHFGLEDDSYVGIFAYSEIESISKSQLKETEITWIKEGIIEISNAKNNDLRPISIKEITIQTFPDTIGRELIQYIMFNICFWDSAYTAENFEIKINDGSEDIAIEYEARRETRNNFKIKMHHKI